MRVSRQAAAENRRRILDAATRLFREHGIAGAGVDAVTEAAGLTHGAFYSQFGSKEAVVAEALSLALDESRGLWEQRASGKDGRRALGRIIDGWEKVAPLPRSARTFLVSRGASVKSSRRDSKRVSRRSGS
jgi:AcrR family transcriptional regulator